MANRWLERGQDLIDDVSGGTWRYWNCACRWWRSVVAYAGAHRKNFSYKDIQSITNYEMLKSGAVQFSELLYLLHRDLTTI